MRAPLQLIGMASVLTLLAACSTTHPTQTQASTASSSASTPAAPQAQTAAVQPNAADQAQLAAQAVAKQRADLNGKSVFFDFDDFTVKSTYNDMLQAQAAFLKAQPNDHLVLQGNADERGSAEYNLALGQKRADAVRKSLTLLGAPNDRIEAVSFGEEKPRATCHEEKCWSENRRADFVHSDKR
ncbi:MAG TPA: peptidoglycan-associated lipoprotein Pal [Aquabacterium sp.]|nr:peptidoglycan-associated lipoprotein Pal [Aquabacterium sp.]